MKETNLKKEHVNMYASWRALYHMLATKHQSVTHGDFNVIIGEITHFSGIQTA